MEHHQRIHCPYCSDTDLQKNGKSPNGTQRWHCKSCKKYFRLSYRYNACKQGIKEQIIVLTLNSSGVRDIGRVLSISKGSIFDVMGRTVAAVHAPSLQ